MKPKPHHTPFRNSALALSFVMLLVLLAGCNLPSRQVVPTATLPPTFTPPSPQNTATPIPPTSTPGPTNTALPTATTTPAPINIVFSSGTTAAVQSGSIQPNQVQAYTLSAGQYQPMILILTSPNNDVYLGVSEPDGTVLLDPAKKWTNWQWLLPKTELYTIRVFGGKTAEDYTLTAKVAQVVSFPSGSTSLTLTGSTPKGYVFSYALACQVNQVMTVTLTVPAGTAYLDVFGLATGPLLSPATKATTWSGTLPSTQDYVIEIIPKTGVVNYTLKVTVK